MGEKNRIFKDDDYDLVGDIAPECDLEELRRRAKVEGREYRGIFSRRDSFGSIPKFSNISKRRKLLMKHCAVSCAKCRVAGESYQLIFGYD
jgi:hypothetical protein